MVSVHVNRIFRVNRLTVYVDIECKNISILGRYQWSYCPPNSTITGNRKHFVLAYPQPQAGSEICQNKTLQFSSKMH